MLRLVLAALLFGHATQKAFGWFRGQGARGTAANFEAWGLRPGLPLAILSSVAELVGATLIALGALVPLGAAIIVGTMFVAVAYNFRHGMWAHQGGYEVALVYGLLAVVLAATGPGPWSIDYLLGLTWLHGAAWAGGALLIGVLGAQGPLALRRAGLKRDAAAESGRAR